MGSKRVSRIIYFIGVWVLLLGSLQPAGAVNAAPDVIQVAIAAGGDHICQLNGDGEVWCWGRNDRSQLGDGTTINRTVPVHVAGLGGGVKAIAAGGLHTCAVTSTGTVKCWGANSSGELGMGSTSTRETSPRTVLLVSDVSKIATGQDHTCALTNAGEVWCWGSNVYGQIGDNTTATPKSTPVKLSLSAVTMISLGGRHSCAIVGGGLKCWGENLSGQLGDQSYTQRLVPTDVFGLTSGVTAVAAGTKHTCAIKTGLGVKCWGDNTYGKIGTGNSAVADYNEPQAVSGLSAGYSGLTAGTDHACALAALGTVRCWGLNSDGQLGNTTYDDSNVPVNVVDLTGVDQLSAGWAYTCTLSGTRVNCWGKNVYGQLGDGSSGPTNKRAYPLEVRSPHTYLPVIRR